MRLNTAVVDPIASAMVASAASENARFFTSTRTANAESCLTCSNPDVPCVSRHSS
jgi:hypothetical protein